MSFRTRLLLFFAIIVVAPLAAVAVLLANGVPGARSGEADARLAQGLRSAYALYQEARADARAQLGPVLADGEFSAAVRSGRSESIAERAQALLERRPDLVEIAVYGPRGERLTRVTRGEAAAVAPAAAAPAGAGGRRLGTVAASTTTAEGFARRVNRLTGLEVVLRRDGRVLAGTVDVPRVPQGSDDVEAGGRELRARVERLGEPIGPPLELTALEPERDPSVLGGGWLGTGAVLAALVLLIVASASLVVRTLQDEIRELVLAARRLRSGDFSRPVAVSGDDSFSELGAEFNAMSEELAGKIRETERQRAELTDVTRLVGDAFAAGLDRRSIVDLMMRAALEQCGADAGRATPIDPAKMDEYHVGSREPQLEVAMQAAERRAFEVRPEEGAELLKRLEQPAGAPAERRRVSQAEIAGVHAASVPLRARISAYSDFQYVGVVSIARRGEPFTAAEADLFAYLANQGAVSLDNAHLHTRAQQQAVTDELTGLFNVRHFHQMLRTEIERSHRFGDPVGLVMVDLDEFKQINDTYGHQQGDLVLREVARILKGLSRDVDEPARYGGEEMALVLPGTPIDGAEEVAERMRSSVEELEVRRLDGHGTLRLTASFGVASLPESAADDASLIAAADAALYRAKRAGRNRVERAEPAAAPR